MFVLAVSTDVKSAVDVGAKMIPIDQIKKENPAAESSILNQNTAVGIGVKMIPIGQDEKAKFVDESSKSSDNNVIGTGAKIPGDQINQKKYGDVTATQQSFAIPKKTSMVINPGKV